MRDHPLRKNWDRVWDELHEAGLQADETLILATLLRVAESLERIEGMLEKDRVTRDVEQWKEEYETE